MGTAIALELLELVGKVGVPAVQSAITALNKPEITLADIKALHGLVNAAETYFAGKAPGGA